MCVNWINGVILMTEYYDKEMEKLEKLQKELHDRYAQEEVKVDERDYHKIVNAKVKLAPIGGEKLAEYIVRIKIYQKIAFDLNWSTHVDNPYKIWHTHKNPVGCFMCNDSAFIAVLIQVLECVAEKNPEFKF